MGDSSDSDRPLKRVKYARREELHDELHDEPKPIVTLPVTMNPRPSVPTNGFPDLREGPVFDNPWIVPPTLPSPTQGLLTLATENANTPWVSAPSGEKTFLQVSYPSVARCSFYTDFSSLFQLGCLVCCLVCCFSFIPPWRWIHCRKVSGLVVRQHAPS